MRPFLAAMMLAVLAACGNPPAHGELKIISDDPPVMVEGSRYPYPKRIRVGTGSVTFAGWYTDADSIVASPGDPQSPRLLIRNIPMTSPGRAARLAAEDAGLKDVILKGPEEIEMFAKWDGTRAYAVVGTGKIGPVRHAIIVWVSESSDHKKRHTELFHAPEKDYRAWGGVVAALSARGAMDDPGVLDADTRKALAGANLDQQLNAFVKLTNIYLGQLYIAIFRTQAATLNMMTSYNMATSNCLMFDKCSVDPDGTGGFRANPDPE